MEVLLVLESTEEIRDIKTRRPKTVGNEKRIDEEDATSSS